MERLTDMDRPGPEPEIEEATRLAHVFILRRLFKSLSKGEARELVDNLWSDPDSRHEYRETLVYHLDLDEDYQRSLANPDRILGSYFDAGEFDMEFLTLKLRAAMQRSDTEAEIFGSYMNAMSAALIDTVLKSTGMGYVDDAGDVHIERPETSEESEDE